MTAESAEPTWLHDLNGNRIGIRVLSGPSGNTVQVLLPDHGVRGTLDATEAVRVIQMLQDGLAFTEITGSSSFRVDPDEIVGP